MKRRDVVNLIRFYTEGNDAAFRAVAYEIAKEFGSSGDLQLSEYILSLLSDVNTFVPQMSESGSQLMERIATPVGSLPLPEPIMADLNGIINAVAHNSGVSKFLFQGPPGSGKTEAAKHLARIFGRELFLVDFSSLIDSHLGQTAKNISELFREINAFPAPVRALVLFDEIDALALDRINTHDVREMGRATSTLLRELDGLNESVVLIATTNLFERFDAALVRRFDFVVDFGRYTQEDLAEVADALLEDLLSVYRFAGRDMRLFHKILGLWDALPYPGDMKNILKTSIAFSTEDSPYDYLRRLYKAVTGVLPSDPALLRSQGFTVREIEKLIGVSKSTIARNLKMVAL